MMPRSCWYIVLCSRKKFLVDYMGLPVDFSDKFIWEWDKFNWETHMRPRKVFIFTFNITYKAFSQLFYVYYSCPRHRTCTLYVLEAGRGCKVGIPGP